MKTYCSANTIQEKFIPTTSFLCQKFTSDRDFPQQQTTLNSKIISGIF